MRQRSMLPSSRPPGIARPALFVWLVGCVWLAAVLRAVPLTEHRFHPDEALYASFGRLIASGRDPLLAQVVVDKPPLPLYVTAASLALVGGHELAARLPAYFASVISVALLGALARRLYALAPLPLLFAITVFIDPLLTAWVLASLWYAARGRPGRAAAALALGFATKQTALFFAPLVLGVVLVTRPPPTARGVLAAVARPAGQLALALLIAMALIFSWDAARQFAGAPIGFWEQGYADNVPNRLIRAAEVGPRATAWLDLLGYLTGSPVVNLGLAVGGLALVTAGLRRPTLPAMADVLWAGYVWLYLAAYWLLAFNVWDRYLVPVAPLVFLLAARVTAAGVRWLGAASARRQLTAGALAIVLGVGPAALTATRAGFPVGGDHGAYAGLEQTARYLNGLPAGAVVYDFWLSWQWNFYLFDGPVYVAWMPTPEALATDLRAFGQRSPRYLVIPSWEPAAEALAAADRAGFEARLVHEAFRPDGSRAFATYQFVPRP